MKTVLLIDDHPVYRAGLRRVVESTGIYEVVGEAEDGPEGLLMAQKLKPDVVIADLRLPSMTGIEVAEKICAMLPDIGVMILSAYSDVRHIRHAAHTGVLGYMTKDSRGRDILECIGSVVAGKRFADRALSDVFFDSFRDTSEGSHDGYGKLTDREQEIMRLIVEGWRPGKIAGELNISNKTVSAHKKKIMKKLGAENDVELVRYAITMGLLDLDAWKYGPGPK